jgi:hypothetical protein
MLFMAYPDRFGDAAGTVIQNVLAYGSCWILGFAHREGDLRKLKPATVLGLAAACVGGGLAWAITHPDGDGVDLVGIPVAYAIYSIGFVLALLRWNPRMDWLAWARPLDGFVSMVNNRAVTVYLWHNVAITIAVALIVPLKLWEIPTQFLSDLTVFAVAMTILSVAVLALGWVEDVAARRPPRVSPFAPRAKKRVEAEEIREPVAA